MVDFRPRTNNCMNIGSSPVFKIYEYRKQHDDSFIKQMPSAISIIISYLLQYMYALIYQVKRTPQYMLKIPVWLLRSKKQIIWLHSTLKPFFCLSSSLLLFKIAVGVFSVIDYVISDQISITTQWTRIWDSEDDASVYRESIIFDTGRMEHRGWNKSGI